MAIANQFVMQKSLYRKMFFIHSENRFQISVLINEKFLQIFHYGICLEVFISVRIVLQMNRNCIEENLSEINAGMSI